MYRKLVLILAHFVHDFSWGSQLFSREFYSLFSKKFFWNIHTSTGFMNLEELLLNLIESNKQTMLISDRHILSIQSTFLIPFLCCLVEIMQIYQSWSLYYHLYDLIFNGWPGIFLSPIKTKHQIFIANDHNPLSASKSAFPSYSRISIKRRKSPNSISFKSDMSRRPPSVSTTMKRLTPPPIWNHTPWRIYCPSVGMTGLYFGHLADLWTGHLHSESVDPDAIRHSSFPPETPDRYRRWNVSEKLIFGQEVRYGGNFWESDRKSPVNMGEFDRTVSSNYVKIPGIQYAGWVFDLYIK